MDAVHAALSRSLSELGVPRGECVLVAVSGGADSVALLHALLALGQRVALGHVHHGLRSDAEADLLFVTALAQRLGVPSALRRVDASTPDGRSPEARARVKRYRALEELRSELAAAWIATAHTLDDQAETVLLRAVRGTAMDGLAGIAPLDREARLLRPLLSVRAAALRAYLRERGLEWREDPSNRELRVPRNRLRRQVLPLLEQVHPGAAEKLAALAELAREARDDEGQVLELALAQAVVATAHGLWLSPGPLLGLPLAARQRALAVLLARVGLAERVTRRHLRRMLRFIDEGGRGAALSLPGDSVLVRREERFWLGPAAHAPSTRQNPRRPAKFRILLPRADGWHGGNRSHGDR